MNTNDASVPMVWTPKGLLVAGVLFPNGKCVVRQCNGMHRGDTITFKVGTVARPFAPCTLTSRRIPGSRLHVAAT